MRILVVEDDKKISNALKEGLEFEGFAIDIAETGTYGYDLASTTDYDLVILDLMLPGMDGMEICKKLREENKHTLILMLTAKSEVEDKIAGLNIGADDYLAKPFSFDELLARIRSLLRRSSTFTPDELTCENLKMNTRNFTVSRGNKNINLSKKEFALLEYLMRNKNKVIAKEDIIEHVWNYDADILPNTVEVYIGYLRNKIDKSFKNMKPLLRTLWGFGYKLEEQNAKVSKN
ncbi:response regulator transcription factor [candidate division WWE3 bacterium]|uniref:Response regulator transcription factor n=1 Tax=candidate division WWE3 bacterium TaxID=2053526 RepID=A0A7X9HTF2_UNCKA|nr:response regulator transcription factor [candidate division WWE3 bacterium]